MQFSLRQLLTLALVGSVAAGPSLTKLAKRDCDCAGLASCQSNCISFGNGVGYSACLASCLDTVGCTETSTCDACQDGTACDTNANAACCDPHGGPCMVNGELSSDCVAAKMVKRQGTCDCDGIGECQQMCGAFGGGVGYIGCLGSCLDTKGCNMESSCARCQDGSACEVTADAACCDPHGGQCMVNGEVSNTCGDS